MKKILKAFGLCALSLTLITSVFGCKKSSTTKKPTTSNTTSDTKITTNTPTTDKTTTVKPTTTAKPTTTVKPTTTKRTVDVLDPKERKTIHIDDYTYVHIYAYDDTETYTDGSTYEVNHSLNFSCRNENNYPVCVSFYGNDDILIKKVNVFENEEKVVSIESNSDVYVKTNKVEVDSNKAFINIDESYNVSCNCYCSVTSEGKTNLYYVTNGGQYPKNSIVDIELINNEYPSIKAIIKVGNTIIDEYEMDAGEKTVYILNDILLSDDLSIEFDDDDTSIVEIFDNDNGCITAYYYDDDYQKVEHNSTFTVKKGTDLYIKVEPNFGDDKTVALRKFFNFDDSYEALIVRKDDTETKYFNGGMAIKASNLTIGVYDYKCYAVNFNTEVEGVSLEVIDLYTKEIYENGIAYIPDYSNIRYLFTNTSGKSVIISGFEYDEKNFLMDGETLFFDRTLHRNITINVEEYVPHKVDIEYLEDVNIDAYLYYNDYNGARHKIISGSNCWEGANIFIDVLNNTNKIVSLKAYDESNVLIKEDTIYPGTRKDYRVLISLENDTRYVFEYIDSDISYNAINIDKTGIDVHAVKVDVNNIILENGNKRFVLNNSSISINITDDSETRADALEYVIKDSNNNIIKIGCVGCIADKDIRFELNDYLVTNDLMIIITKIDKEAGYKLSMDTGDFSDLEVKYSEGRDIQDFDDVKCDFIKIKATNYNPDKNYNLEIQYVDGEEVIYSINYGILEYGKEFVLDTVVWRDLNILISECSE